MSDFEKKTIKNKEIDHLRAGDSEIGEKVDFAFLIGKCVDTCERMKLLSFLTNDNFVGYYMSVESFRDLFSGVADSDFKEKMSKLDSQLEICLKDCVEYNGKLRKDWDGDPTERTKIPNYHDFGRLYFIECVKFAQKKGLGLTEIETEGF